ncbi:hypothetical protein [Micromonospora avicenniae]|uniref:hypothetical protein n=1 Tax=Micromonospora avicenniae TaxID=1198245 RepID=UPI0033222067
MLAADEGGRAVNNVPEEIVRVVEPPVIEALSKWLADSGTVLKFDRWITPGLSGAVLATVVLERSGEAAKGVMMKVCPPGRATGKEADRHADALKDVPQFAANHLVAQPVPAVRGQRGWSIMFQEVAGGSMRTIRPLSTMRGNSLSQAVATIVGSILTEWNAAPGTNRQNPVTLFRDCLGTRTVEGGPVDQLAQQIVYGTAADSLPGWVRSRSGAVVPNVIAWARSEVWAENLADDHVMVVVGHAHGDLHVDNVLVPQKPKPDPARYRLIDLAAYSSVAPLARDPAHLLLSILLSDVAEISDAKRVALSNHLVDSSAKESEHLQIAGLIDLAGAVSAAGEQFAGALGLLDHWQDQVLLVLAANALIFAIRQNSPAIRQWCFELSCAALGRYCVSRGIAVPADAPTAAFRGVQDSATIGGAQAFEALASVCGEWSSTRTSVLVVDSARLTPEARARISALHWRLVVDLNPATDIDGGWASGVNTPGDRRLATMDQPVIFGRKSTVWFAAAGLSDAEPVDPGKDIREWRLKHYRFAEKAIKALAETSSHPASIVCIGEARGAERAIVEACMDAFGARAEVILVASSGTGLLSDYATKTIHSDPNDLLQAVPDRAVALEVQGGRVATLPGRTGQIAPPSELVKRFADSMDLLHSEVGLQADPDAEPGVFFRGRPITWYELDLGLDVHRQATVELVNDVLRPSLQQRNTQRVTLAHAPGAGGTTMARRAAWDLKDEYATLYVRGSIDESIFAQAVRELAILCDTSVLVVAELVPDMTVRRVFEALRADTVPAVLLITTRRSTARRQARQPGAENETERNGRSVHVGALTTRSERLEMAQRFADLVPDRATELLELAARATDNNVPFFYALTAFGTDFEGISSYVGQFLVDLTETEREVLILVSLCHRFCGVPVPAELFAELLNIRPTEDVDLLAEVRAELNDLLIEEPAHAWRTTHSLVAEELLRQLLSPSEGTPAREDWKASLPAWSLRLIDAAAGAFGRRLPADMKSIIDRLFTTRESREPVGSDGGATTYTDLMQAMSAPGRLQILKALVEAFSDEPHYWGHLARTLSYDAGDFSKALAAADRAVALSPQDPLLHHMRGMVFRNEMRTRIRDRAHDSGSHERQVLGLCQSANDAFRIVSTLDDTTEYGHIALAQTNIDAIDYGFRLSEAATYAQFLTRSASGRYRDLLADAEESLDAAREIRGSDQASYQAETADIEINRFYDDYSALLQGWQNLLERANLAKPPIRRRLVRAYRNRAGSWQKAPAKDVRRAVGLLEENLLDNPRDVLSLLEWLRAARYTGASLDKAADLVSGWARTEESREALFYDYVISFLLAMDGQESAVRDYRRKLDRCRERAAWFSNRRFSYEWLGKGPGLARLVHHSDVANWDRRSGTPAPSSLHRLPGRVHAITKSTAGTIDLGRGIEAFVVPSASDLVRGRDENARITALVAFRYDGPIAFNVQKDVQSGSTID